MDLRAYCKKTTLNAMVYSACSARKCALTLKFVRTVRTVLTVLTVRTVRTVRTGVRWICESLGFWIFL